MTPEEIEQGNAKAKSLAAYCTWSPTQKHIPDYRATVALYGPEMVVSVGCKHCGNEGTVTVDTQDLHWD